MNDSVYINSLFKCFVAEICWEEKMKNDKTSIEMVQMCA